MQQGMYNVPIPGRFPQNNRATYTGVPQQPRMQQHWAPHHPPEQVYSSYIQQEYYANIPVPNMEMHVPGHTTQPMQMSTANTPPGRMNMFSCCQCRHVNIMAEGEVTRLDQIIVNLHKENEMQANRIKELENTISCLMSERDQEPSDSSKASHKPLSPDAIEFNPKKTDVPVVSASMITDEPPEMPQAEVAPARNIETSTDQTPTIETNVVSWEQTPQEPESMQHPQLDPPTPMIETEDLSLHQPQDPVSMQPPQPDTSALGAPTADSTCEESNESLVQNEEECYNNIDITDDTNKEIKLENRFETVSRKKHHNNSRRESDSESLSSYQGQEIRGNPKKNEQQNRQSQQSNLHRNRGGLPQRNQRNVEEGGGRSFNKDNEGSGSYQKKNGDSKHFRQNNVRHNNNREGTKTGNTARNMAWSGTCADDKFGSNERLGDGDRRTSHSGSMNRETNHIEPNVEEKDVNQSGQGNKDKECIQDTLSNKEVSHRGPSYSDVSSSSRVNQKDVSISRHIYREGEGRSTNNGPANRDSSQQGAWRSNGQGGGRIPGRPYKSGTYGDKGGSGPQRHNQEHKAVKYSHEDSQGGASKAPYAAKPEKDMITEVKGDLFSAPTEYSLAHCVGADFRMGSGIAVKFKQEFKGTGYLLQQDVGVGGCAYLEDKKNKRYIFYLVTKMVSTGKPTYNTFKSSLQALKEKCKQLAVTKLAIPHIGCGLDKLDWDTVKSHINNTFQDYEIDIRAYDFNAEGLPEAEGNRPTGSYSIKVVYNIMKLQSIDSYTILLFLGTEDGYMDSTATSLDEKLHFAQAYKSANKSVGNIWSWYSQNKEYKVCALIVSKTYVKNSINFETLEKCCREVNKTSKKEDYHYLGLECLSDWSDKDNALTEKVVTLMKHIMNRPIIELWVCYREEKEDVFKLSVRYAARQP